MFNKLFKRKTQIIYVDSDPIYHKQNDIIKKFINISLYNEDINDASKKMINVIREHYSMKNCSLFIKKNNVLEYLATDVPDRFKDSMKDYVNTILTESDALFLDSLQDDSLTYPSAEQRGIKCSMFVYLRKLNETLGALYIELDNKDIEIFEQELFKTIMESITLGLTSLIFLQEKNDLLHKDFLTQLYNRTYLNEYVNKLKNTDYSLAMIDIDFFKKINDKFGHNSGDQILKFLSATFRKLCKELPVFRIGGEEFLIFLPNHNKIELSVLAEDIRLIVEDSEFINEDEKLIKFTISCGISGSKDGINFEDVMNKADQELYKSKNTGRNKITVSS